MPGLVPQWPSSRGLDVLGAQRLLEQHVLAQVDLRGGEIVREAAERREAGEVGPRPISHRGRLHGACHTRITVTAMPRGVKETLRDRRYSGAVSRRGGGVEDGRERDPRRPMNRWHQYRVRRLTHRVVSLRAELDRLDEADPVARLEVLYQLADEVEKLDRWSGN